MPLIIATPFNFIPDTFTSLSNPNSIGTMINEDMGAITAQTSNPIGTLINEDMGAITAQTSNPIGTMIGTN